MPTRSLYPACCRARRTPSICQGADEQAGYQVCQEMLILIPVGTSLGRADSESANFINCSISSRTVSGVVFKTATLPFPGNSDMCNFSVEDIKFIYRNPDCNKISRSYGHLLTILLGRTDVE